MTLLEPSRTTGAASAPSVRSAIVRAEAEVDLTVDEIVTLLTAGDDLDAVLTAAGTMRDAGLE
ncbi:MAG: hypothetical protein CMH38_11085, partial [Microbacterium sp.]